MDVSQIAHFFEQWIHAHPQWLFSFILIVSAAESIAIIGMIVPGVVLLFVAGTLIGKGLLGLEAALIAAWIGAFAGDFFSFIIGHHFHSHIRDWRLFKKHKTWVDKGERFFLKYGGLSIFIGRFAGPGRAVLPLVGGMMGMSTLRFIIIDLIAGILWAFAYLAPGYLVGASMQWTDVISTEFVYTVCAIAVFAWLASFIYCYLMRSEKGPFNHPLFHGLLLTVVFVVWAILDKSGLLNGLNENLALSIIHGETLLTDKINVIITLLGSDFIQLLWAAMICLALWYRHNIKSAISFGVTMIGLVLIVSLIKWGFDITRPPNMSGKTGQSFPSGHTSITTFLMFAMVYYIASSIKPRLRFLVWGLALFVSMMVALSRLYLNVHWFADVTGAVLIGLLAYAIWQYLEKKTIPPIRPAKPVIFSLAWVIMTVVFSIFLYPQTSLKYLGIN